LANQSNDFTRADTQADVVERNNPWESFADSLHFEDWGVCSHRLASSPERVEIFSELIDVVFLDRFRRYEDLFTRRHSRLIAVEDLRHHLHRAIAKLERLLHDRGVNRAVLDSAQRFILFVESHDLH